jgi:ribosomal protein S18 acetylase RimI-like enzyme
MLIADKDQTVDEKTFFDNGFSYISDMLMLVSIASENMKQFDNDFLHNKNYPQLQFIPISETVVKNNKSLETDKKNYREKLLNLICKTYINAKDFPQLLALTSADRLLDEYEQNVFYRPELCFFVRKLQDSNNGNNDIGVLLLIDSPPDQIELTYMGLVEEERGRGYSQELLQFTQKTAIQYGRKLVLTAVDERNTNALRAYIKQGFLTWDRKKIYAKFF